MSCAIARDDERANRDERRLLNRLRADLIAVFPAALAVAGDDMGAPTFLRMLQRWPTAEALASAARAELVAFARANHSRFAERFADRVQAACAHDHFVAPDYLARAKSDSIRLAAAQLLLIGGQPGRGSGAWVTCCWVPLGAARPTSPPSTCRGGDFLAVRSTSASGPG